ncbi:5-demethoxyubiquinol-8 5-hydroxylase UbiM [Candidatus Thioglobus sp.]|jgi:ubiquinone biosynthesis UbiH/UbiF/VisC/COQ6 family hydroxylase|uniref:5-demethoxyubiquinol-8 5-hydroxylase UbiM n=1 Tax=Candidatus Thioglobus sp. TaxID=2026721 RepID=UPI001DE7335B|nr:5-demethoxyubiquinol-8 5-hydroxylase UbiM [Candidatus Thioglobus sp.]MBT3276661.1 5-demethoxyubiquinol-8 5-hydroxylase UbiM [Candidatus Thioglobus sp.]MBT3745401.1 5-demethoxyubiquinol-8 5-hydroxylase UbiM [Candidatus Thioglobus sp.]MBT4746922.1 5-demethoxyubiquinol-8 5-hydroxylase UbiM [Candidatus Thioglobus sp.]MBT5165413.1 5-demethoxyubiquinol-8 5-hydroxylase UbiM [Candidatus Thioglobus sp.]MBT6022005.1 5-demethoxyubiquinol-8 5-hydroxylase UbiM [Candidatus Thioglobus sp.]
MQTPYDIVIIGSGPAGLSFACSMLELGIKVLLIERSNFESISNPKEDGREIALTHLSLKILKKLGVWELIDQSQVAPLKEAKVFDGDSPSLLNFKPDQKNIDALGYLVPNHLIRQALFDRIKDADNIDLKTDAMVSDVKQQKNNAQVILENGDIIDAKLVIAADSRFSEIRRKVGIPTLMKDFSKVMIVTKMTHEKPHHNIALECFDYGKTLALLPMVGSASSVVLTVKTNESKKMLDMSDAEFNKFITHFFKHEFGEMTQAGVRHSYPLIGTHAQTFIAQRFALIGDASVGMHPVTAHGFNLGLRGQDILANLVKEALDHGQDIGSDALLKLYEKKHINLTRLMFFGTNGVVALFTNDAPVIKQVRRIVLKIAEHFPPVKYLISQHLTEAKKSKFLPF